MYDIIQFNDVLTYVMCHHTVEILSVCGATQLRYCRYVALHSLMTYDMLHHGP